MAFTPVTVMLLRAIRRAQGRPLRTNAADIGIHRDRDDDGLERAQVSRLWAEDWDCPEDAAYDDL